MQNEQGLSSKSKGFPSNLERIIYPLCVDDLNSNAFGAGLGDARKARST